MDENLLDLRGRTSPEPLVEAQRVMGAGDLRSFVVLLSDVRSADQIETLAASLGWTSRVEPTPTGDLRVSLRARRSPSVGFVPVAPRPDEVRAASTRHVTPLKVPRLARTVVLLTSTRLGDGELGETLLTGFVQALSIAPVPPDAVVLVNEAVRLLADPGPVHAALEALARAGTAVLAESTCAERFAPPEHLRVARPAAMVEITELMLSADRVIRL